MNSPVQCTICDQPARVLGWKDGFQLYRCQACRHVFVWPMPPDHLRIYSDRYFSGAEEGFGYRDYDRDKEPMIPTFEEYLDRLGRHAGQPGTLIDIGAASGFFLSLARRRGWRVSGVEPSDFASSLARDKGLDVRTGTVENCHFAAGAFDVVTMWDVIEHIPDPRRAIASIVSLLKPGGLIAINTPDSTCLLARLLKTKWHLVVPPEHLNLFSRESLRLLLAKHGLEVLEAATIGKTFTVQYVLMTLAHWQRLHVFDAASEAVRGRRLGQWKISLNLRDNVFMIARKK